MSKKKHARRQEGEWRRTTFGPSLPPLVQMEARMSLFPDDDRPKPKAVHEIGQDLSMLSLAEIDQRIEVLKAEIERLAQARTGKAASRNAADAFFRKAD